MSKICKGCSSPGVENRSKFCSRDCYKAWQKRVRQPPPNPYRRPLVANKRANFPTKARNDKIKELYAGGIRTPELAVMYNLSRERICQIVATIDAPRE